MRIQGEHRFVSSRDEVWRGIQDPGVLLRALPGGKRLTNTGPDEYSMSVGVGVGSVKGSYEGTFRLEDKRDLESCVVRASARGTPGSAEVIAQMALRDGEDGGALMVFEADANVTGALAGVGQRLISAAAKKTTRDFLAALDRELLSPGAAGPAAAAADPGAPVARTLAARGPAVLAEVPKAGSLGLAAIGGFAMALLGVLIGFRLARRP